MLSTTILAQSFRWIYMYRSTYQITRNEAVCLLVVYPTQLYILSHRVSAGAYIIPCILLTVASESVRRHGVNKSPRKLCRIALRSPLHSATSAEEKGGASNMTTAHGLLVT